jgi:thymidine kinase
MRNESPFTPGFLEVYCGPMKSGKSLELIHRVNKLKYMNNIQFSFFKPDIDTRDNTIHSRCSNTSYECTVIPAENPHKIFDYLNGEKVVLFDEVQFFNKNIVDVVNKLMQRNLNVVVAGLDLDYRREPFGSMPQLLAMADYVEKLWAVCDEQDCIQKGRYTRINQFVDGVIAIENNSNMYSVTCLKHHFIPILGK